MKKLLSVFMAVAMLMSIFSVLGVTVNAENTDIIGTEYTAMTFTPADESQFATYKNSNGEWGFADDLTPAFQYNAKDIFFVGNKLTFSGEGVEDMVFICNDDYKFVCGEKVLENEYIQTSISGISDAPYVQIKCNGLEAQQPIELLASPVKSIEVVNGNIALDAYSEGSYANYTFGEAAGEAYFLYNAVGNKDVEFKITYKDKTTATVYGDGDGDLCVDRNGSKEWLTAGYDYTVCNTQYVKEWAVGSTQKLTYWFQGYPVEVSFDVAYAEGAKEVESISYERNNDKYIFADLEGYDLDCGCADCVANDGYKFYSIEKLIPAKDDVVKIKYVGDEVEYTYTYNEKGKLVGEDGKTAKIKPYIYDMQRQKHWGIGDNTVYVYFGGKTATTTIEVAKPVITSIKFSHAKRQAYENTWGYAVTNEAGEEYFEYDMPIYRVGTTLTITFEGDETKVYEYSDDFYDVETGEKLPFEINWDVDQEVAPFGVGENEIVFNIGGCTDTVVLEVLENPIEKIDFVPAKAFSYIENQGGEWEEYHDLEEDVMVSYYRYDIEDSDIFADGNKIIVYNKNGKKYTYTYSSEKGGFYTKSGGTLRQNYPVEWAENQTAEPWVLGSDNYFYVSHMGHTAKVPVTIKPVPKPKMATIKSCVNGNGKITITWTEVENADTYEVFRCETKANGKAVGGWKKLKAGIKTLKYVDKGVEKNTYYKYIVHARNKTGRSDFKSSKAVYTQYIAPITGFKVKNTIYGVEINWDRYAGGNVIILRKADGDKKWTRICEVASDHKYVCEDAVKSGKTYQFAIRAASGEIVSSYTYSDKITFLSAPKLKSVTNNKNGITFKWEKVEGATEYIVYKRTGNGGYKKIATTQKLTYLDKSVKSGTNYRYTVKASNGEFVSGYRTGLKLLRLDEPVLLSATSTKKGIVVKWESVKGAKEYYVYRKTGNSGWVRIGSSSGEKTSGTDPSAKKGVTYSYTLRAVSGKTLSSYSKTGVSCKDKY